MTTLAAFSFVSASSITQNRAVVTATLRKEIRANDDEVNRFNTEAAAYKVVKESIEELTRSNGSKSSPLCGRSRRLIISRIRPSRWGGMPGRNWLPGDGLWKRESWICPILTTKSKSGPTSKNASGNRPSESREPNWSTRRSGVNGGNPR